MEVSATLYALESGDEYAIDMNLSVLKKHYIARLRMEQVSKQEGYSFEAFLDAIWAVS